MEYWKELSDISVVLVKDRSREPWLYTGWINFPYDRAVRFNLQVELEWIAGVTKVRLSKVEHGAPGTTIINIEKRSRASWDEVLPRIESTIRTTLEIEEATEEVLNPPWTTS